MSTHPDPPQVRVDSASGLLAVIPHLLGFTPRDSLVVVGADLAAARVGITFRYDLPDPPDCDLAADIAAHAVGVLQRQHLTSAAVVGYGPGVLVTPVADAVRAAAARAGLDLHDTLRVDEGRYWSYQCTDPSCCPPEGVPLDPAHPAAAAMAPAGRPVLPDRAALAATIAPLTGPEAGEIRAAALRAERAAVRRIAVEGPAAVEGPGLAAVLHVIGVYRDGGSIESADVHAWLALMLVSLRVRDDAWARMDPAHSEAHLRLWTDVIRRAQPGYVAGPACLLAFTAWQRGEGALANLALDRADAENPFYSMAELLRNAITAGAPPSVAILPMTPEEVADSYASPGDGDGPLPARRLAERPLCAGRASRPARISPT